MITKDEIVREREAGRKARLVQIEEYIDTLILIAAGEGKQYKTIYFNGSYIPDEVEEVIAKYQEAGFMVQPLSGATKGYTFYLDSELNKVSKE